MDIRVIQTDEELKDAYFVRKTVFIKEQNVPPEIEIDDKEEEAVHFIGYVNDKPAAASRLRFVDQYGKLERICVLKEQRGNSYGKDLMEKMEKVIKDKGYSKAKLNSQTHAEGFYLSLGYQTVSEEFIDAGIPHVTMVKQL